MHAAEAAFPEGNAATCKQVALSSTHAPCFPLHAAALLAFSMLGNQAFGSNSEKGVMQRIATRRITGRSIAG